MVEQILKSVLEAQGIRLEDYKKNAAWMVIQTAKRYWKYLAAASVVVLVAIVTIIWAIWSVIAWAGTMLKNEGGDAVKKIEEVGINWLIEEPLRLVRELWYGKDGK